jgi:hypothetical protein
MDILKNQELTIFAILPFLAIFKNGSLKMANRKNAGFCKAL